MNTPSRILAFITLLLLPLAASADQTAPAAIKLNKPDMTRGLPVMQALAARSSATEWSDKSPSLQDLSDLLWAANGINRPDSGKRTAPSALNAQDVKIYVFTTEAVYVYDEKAHALSPVANGDHREEVLIGHGGKPIIAPVELILVSDGTKFAFGSPEQRHEWGCLDAGIVSQNISIFCAATGLATRPRASINQDKIKTLLVLKDDQLALLDHPVGFAAQK